MSEQIAHAVAGAGGGALAAVVTYPLITLSTRAQIAAKDSETSNLEAIKRILEDNGIKKLYAGLSSALWGMTLTNFVYYYFYEGIKIVFVKKGTLQMSTLESMLASAYAGGATALVTNPIWVVNTRMMVAENETTFQVIKGIVQKEGLGTFFTGLTPSLFLVINPILNYSIFEKIRYFWLSRRGRISSLDTFVMGALSKIVATTVTYPLITLKSRLQAQKSESSKEKQASILKRLLAMWHTLEISDLYKGWSLKVLQSALQSAFLFLFKDQLFELALLLVSLRSRRLQLRL